MGIVGLYSPQYGDIQEVDESLVDRYIAGGWLPIGGGGGGGVTDSAVAQQVTTGTQTKGALDAAYTATVATASTATSSATLLGDRHTPVDATSGALTMTLPTPIRVGQQVRVEKVDATANAVTIAGTLRGNAGTVVMPFQYEVLTFVAESLSSWRVASGNKTKAALDATYGQVLLFTDPRVGGNGNGATDNTAAWNRAMALLEAGTAFAAPGGTLYFPPGVYKINETTNPVPGGVMLVGAGINYGAPAGSAAEGATPARSSVIRAGAVMSRLIQLGRNPDTSAPADTGASMRDLIVDGQDLAATVVATGGRRNYIHNCQIYWGSTYAVDFLGQNSYLIGGVVAQNNKGTCINIGSHADHKVFDAQIRQPGTTGSCVRIAAGDVMVRGCHMWTGQNGVATTADSLIQVTATALIVGIYNNILEGIGGPEIKLTSGCYAVNITGNQFFNNGNSTDLAHPVIRAVGTGSTSPLSDILVSSNVIRGRSAGNRFKALIEYTGTFASTERIVVAANEMLNCAALISGAPVQQPLVSATAWSTGSLTQYSEDSGITTFSGDGSTLTFTIPTAVPSVGSFTVTPASAAVGAAQVSHVAVSGTSLAVTMRAAPVSGSGNVSLAWRVSVNGATTVMAGVPGQVTGLMAGTPTSTTQPLTWTAVADATSYKVQYRTSGATTWIDGPTPATNSATVTGLTANTAYDYRVAAVNASGTGAYSATVPATTAAAGAPGPVVADNFAGTSGTSLKTRNAADGSSSLPWSVTSTSATPYDVIISPSGQVGFTGGPQNILALLDPGLTAYTLTTTVPVLLGDANLRRAVLMFRHADATNTWRLASHTDGAWKLQKLVSNTATTVATGPTAAPGDALKVVVTGTTVAWYVNNAQVGSAVSDTFLATATKVGFLGVATNTQGGAVDPTSRFGPIAVSA